MLHVDWESHVTGGVVLLPREREYQGRILYLGSGEELVIQKINPLIGLGIIEVTVNVGTTTESQKGLLLFFLFVPLES
jgi:hypothetical protein